MTARARLNREDYRRRFLNGVLVTMGRGRDRDSVSLALGEAESRRRGLLDQMSYDDQVVAYTRELEQKEAARATAVPAHPRSTAGV